VHHWCSSDAAVVLWSRPVTHGCLQVTAPHLTHSNGDTRHDRPRDSHQPSPLRLNFRSCWTCCVSPRRVCATHTSTTLACAGVWVRVAVRAHGVGRTQPRDATTCRLSWAGPAMWPPHSRRTGPPPCTGPRGGPVQGSGHVAHLMPNGAATRSDPGRRWPTSTPSSPTHRWWRPWPRRSTTTGSGVTPKAGTPPPRERLFAGWRNFYRAASWAEPTIWSMTLAGGAPARSDTATKISDVGTIPEEGRPVSTAAVSAWNLAFAVEKMKRTW
jgi:hypothetical protein